MSKRLRIAVSMVCAVLAATVCLAYTTHVREEADRTRTEAMRRYGGEVVSLVAAVRAIEAGEVVTMADVETRDWLSSLAPEGAQTNIDDVLGREVSVPVSAGAPLTELNFRDPETMAEIPSGHVAVAVPITEKLGVTTGISVGTHVVTYRATDGSAELIGGDATVWGVPSGSSVSRGSLTIAVTAADVPAVLAASASGDLRIVVPADDVKKLAEGGTGRGASVPPVGNSVSPTGEDSSTADDATDHDASNEDKGAETDERKGE